MSDATSALRNSSMCRQLSLLARGELSARALTESYLGAIERENPERNAFWVIDQEGALAAADAADLRRARGEPLGRLDGIPLAVKDNFDVKGLPTSGGLVGRRQMVAEQDAHCIARLRGAGAVILGKTSLDEAMLGTTGAHPTFGHVPHPLDAGLAAGGSSAGSAVAVAAGLASAAIGTDTLGSVRIPAAFCGVYGLRPTQGEISCAGVLPALPRLDVVGPLARSLDDLTLLLQVMSGYDNNDPRSRRRRVPLALPDWEPGSLRCGVIADPADLGAEPEVVAAFDKAIEECGRLLGKISSVPLAGFELPRLRRAAFLMMEAGLASLPAAELEGASARLQSMLDFARCRTAVHYAHADRALDSAVIATRRLFEQVDVLLLPTVPQPPPPLGAEEPSHLADFCSFASLAGCPALSLPLPGQLGLSLVGPRGSDLRLLELGEVIAALLGNEQE
ncbi:amidase [Pseudomarimonas salicorniae]|uniref:Amidase n=1 Tax=Pseudomarimonas salicorniae TaxID=2933270 RepID=A0ABT0GHV6_9GAMM|nr:amidase [Lysobacter sp. CAU 1642]MCK7594013.1 amidase [Lysobacter sp. CAU 1642]